MNKICICCGEAFETNRNADKYCSPTCMQFFMNQKEYLTEEIRSELSVGDHREWVNKNFISSGLIKVRFLSHRLTKLFYGVDIEKEVNSFPHSPRCNIQQKWFAWLYEIKHNGCVVCGEPVQFHETSYRKFCSNKCMNKSMAIGGVHRHTLNSAIEEKYGEHPMRQEHIKNKLRNVFLEKYGVPSNLCLESNKIAARQTLFERYGAYHPLQSPIIMSKLEETNMSRYGVPHVLCKGSPICELALERMRYSLSGGSSAELELGVFLKEMGVGYEASNRSVLSGKELDIYCPGHKLAIEFNGLYWHCEHRKVGKDYHLEKVEACEAQGIQLIHIWEDEWTNKMDVVKDMLSAKMGLNRPSSYARQMSTKEYVYSEVFEFLEQHHIQGAVIASHYIGLSDKQGEIQAVMLFTKRAHGIELVRFASNNCHGAFSKLLSHAIKYCLDPNQKIYSFGDRCVVSRLKNVYLHNGFVEKEVLPPDYKYVVNNFTKRDHKFNWRKEKFKSLGYDVDGKTEDMLALEHGISKIWGCGLIRYEYEGK
ncbi:homing endonuclease [Dickeya phage vB-DsoM-LIMEstone1]|uniref:Homing endonuclease F-LimX n=9 Tax=Limestonevirus limestone TaxID=1091052 RepID=I0J345_9CAUD|nr:homing endonuclease [Dickeya phage vB-DsoM-LIMEstone1]ASD51356.1 putative homing endonuclease F-LimX [Dickeya phage JA15]ASD51551.1 putative homing endonuclease F-LimX [Dickeya phage XF4]AYN55550.1 hypothetical protein [Dickeya phage Coodle]QHB41677.1 hypothetical protein [Dickeya phage Ds5CZ]QHB41880.1 hypothetical protein [Dickeya phage Ds9CZ]QHB42286.1 hypothetical protein [Dickeya phage Ds20CZ]QHB42680.1 hypothetical protein [Dickeya phage Ds25CZ]QHB42915.1 hypothetical protein [Dick